MFDNLDDRRLCMRFNCNRILRFQVLSPVILLEVNP